MLKVIRILALVLVAASPALSQSDQQSVPITLSDAVQLGLQQNLSVLQAENSINAAKSTVLAAYGDYLPSVSFSGGWSRQQTDRAASTQIIGGQPFNLPASFSVDNSFSTSLSVGYTLFDGFSREATLGRATSYRDATIEQANRTKQSIVYLVESSYLNILRTEQLVRVSEENLKRDQRQLDRIVESNKLGALSVADVYRQQSQVASDEVGLITAQNNFDKAKADLASLIGLDMSKEYEFVDRSIMTDLSKEELDATMQKYSNYEGLWKRALAARPDYLSAKDSYNAASSGVVSARRGYFPSIVAYGRYSMANESFKTLSENKTTSWGLSLSWTIFDGFLTNQQIQTAVASERNAELSMAQTERNIAVDVKKALLDLEAARKQYDAAQKGLVSATQDRKTAEERYNVGSGTLLDLLVANAGYVNAEANTINASYNFIISRRNVEYSLGERSY